MVDAAIWEASLEASTRVEAIVSDGGGEPSDERKTARECRGEWRRQKNFSGWTALDEREEEGEGEKDGERMKRRMNKQPGREGTSVARSLAGSNIRSERASYSPMTQLIPDQRHFRIRVGLWAVIPGSGRGGRGKNSHYVSETGAPSDAWYSGDVGIVQGPPCSIDGTLH